MKIYFTLSMSRLKISAQNREIDDLIEDIEDKDDLEEKEDMKDVFLNKLKTIPKYSYRERGVCLYYVLRILMKTHQHYESPDSIKYYEKMRRAFRMQHDKYKERLRRGSRLPKSTRTKIGNFYKLMERFYSSLEVIYDKKDFLDAVHRSYEEKMYFRKHGFLFHGKRWRYIEYAFLDVSCKYGDSFFRWGLTALFFSIFLSFVYAGLDFFSTPQFQMIQNGYWYDYVYFSVVTLTSLGYGDIAPVSAASKFVASVEVFFGFIMLGVFVNMIQKKL